MNLFTLALESKKLDLLNKLVPSGGTFAYLTNPNNPAAEERANEMRDTARWGRSGSRPGGSEGPRSCLGSSQAIGHSVILVTAPSNEALVNSCL